jgi:hypothetical protein
MILSGLASYGPILAAIVACAVAVSVITKWWAIERHLRPIPGPRLYALSNIPLAINAWHGRSVHTMHQLHLKYGPAVRVGPQRISFNSLSALRTIYGAGSPFERTDFYSMFDVYGRPNMFTMASGYDHRERKKTLSHMYSNQTVLASHYSSMVMNKVAAFFTMLEKEPKVASETFASLHYFSLDAISEFVYGPSYGGTNAQGGAPGHREMITDILDDDRRRLSWFAVHIPAYTKWITSQTGWVETVIAKLGLLPMLKPFTYTGIREHGLKAFYSFKNASPDEQLKYSETSVIGRMMKIQTAQGLSDMDIASECADHLLAGIDTTADTMMFLIWALSLPKNTHYQEELREEVSHVSVDEQGLPEPKSLTNLVYLNAVIKETLRLYSSLPAYEPRLCRQNTVIDGFDIPAGTIVGMSPYCLHRQEDVYPDALAFRPERWLTPSGELVPESDPKNRFFWAFSSGGRMCIGLHLAMAEMLTLTATLYRRYRTKVPQGTENTSPGITSRYEVFYDERSEKVNEHESWIDFQKLE